MKNRNLTTAFTSLLCAFGAFAQIDEPLQHYPFTEPCATMPALEHFLEEHPSLSTNMAHGEERVEKWTAKNAGAQKGGGLVIPVVVHVLYNPSVPEQNIPDSVIHSQIDVLNEDFQRLNANAVNTRPEFDSIAVDLNISFCLASSDPQGGSTTGINRVSTTADFAFTAFSNNVKRTIDGGQDPWDPAHYLNIWVCDMSFLGQPLVLGYAQFPLSSQESIDLGAVVDNDGVVIQYQYFGRTNDPNTFPNNLGRTTTHEVGHWLGLRHIWGDGDCSQDDMVEDTPSSSSQSQFDCNFSKNSCNDSADPYWNGNDPHDMVENYMDYSADECMNMFSAGQSTRIWAFLNTDSLRNSLFTSGGCMPATGVHNGALSEHAFHVYPNPSSGYFRVEWPDNLGSLQIQIVDQVGRIVQNIIPAVNDTQLVLDLDKTSPGVYFVIFQADLDVMTKKLVLE